MENKLGEESSNLKRTLFFRHWLEIHDISYIGNDTLMKLALDVDELACFVDAFDERRLALSCEIRIVKRNIF